MLLTLVLAAAFLSGGCSYNDLTAKQQNVRGKWANIESALQRRADLIPNLMTAAQTAGVQEQEVFGQISEARSRLLNAQQAQQQVRTVTELLSSERPSLMLLIVSAVRSVACSACRSHIHS